VDLGSNSSAILDCAPLCEWINLTTNNTYFQSLPYYDIQFAPSTTELIQYNQGGMTIGLPNQGSNPANPDSQVMRNAGVQLLAMRYQLNDSNLEENDNFFNSNAAAFVLKPSNLRAQPLAVPTPNTQDPALSYSPRTVTGPNYTFQI